MGLDIRKPIGGLLIAVGLQLAVYGMLSDPSIYKRSMDINVNLAWGLVLTGGGALFLLWSRRAEKTVR
ncbi:MAG: hypothetical protein FJW20_16885 [Acidimicrobiia bacterium]|nr:hypothetical protein [Acidimicrobiia bacterium]